MPGPADEADVRAVEAAYDRAWSNGDLDGLMACFGEGAVLVSPRGDVAVGAEEIRALLGGFLAGEASDSVHETTVDRISFVGDDVAVFDGHAVISHRSGANLVAVLEHHFTDIIVRNGGTWSIVHIRAYNIGPGRA